MRKFTPLLFCFIGPGASGKSTICRALKKTSLPVVLSISATSRLPRGSEREGVEYYFKTKDQFEKEISENSFLEYAEFAGSYYGTPMSNLENAVNLRSHLVLDMELNGVKILKEKFKDDVIVTFVCPPKLSDLRERFEFRGTDTPERIDERMRIAKYEVEQALQSDVVDYLIVNRDLDQSIKEASSIITSEQILIKRQNFSPF